MTEQARAPQFEQPPSGLTPQPLTLDGVTFTPDKHGRIECAKRDGVHLGDVLLDLESTWFARKVGPDHKLSDWKQMRCVHEARAYLVSRVRP